VCDGTIAVFDRSNHPKAKRAYAMEDRRRMFFAVLHVPPITGPA
jgi:hypothetical protein